MSYVYVYIYTLYTGANVCVYVYAVSGNECAYSIGAYAEVCFSVVSADSKHLAASMNSVDNIIHPSSNRMTVEPLSTRLVESIAQRSPYCTYALHYAYYLYLHAFKTEENGRSHPRIGDRLCIS